MLANSHLLIQLNCALVCNKYIVLYILPLQMDLRPTPHSDDERAKRHKIGVEMLVVYLLERPSLDRVGWKLVVS